MPRLIDTEALFRATLELFAKKGYDLLTTREVARRSGVNEATIYRRYGSKVALVEAALTYGLGSAPFADLRCSDDLASDLEELVASFQATTHTYGAVVVPLLVEIARHPELSAALAPLQANIARAAGVLLHHQNAGRLRASEPMQQLVLLLAPVMAGALWARAGNTEPGEADPRRLVTAFLDGQRAADC